MISLIQQMIAPLRTRISNMVARGVLRRVDDSKKVQILQLEVLAGEVRAGLERFQQYGFTSVPFEGAEAAVVFVGGRRDHGLVVAVDDRRYRLVGLQQGEVALYTDQGDSIVIKRGGTIEITAATAVHIAGSSDAALKGDSYASAESTFLDALNAYASAIKSVADPSGTATAALATAVSTFKTATIAAKSGKVKLG